MFYHSGFTSVSTSVFALACYLAVFGCYCTCFNLSAYFFALFSIFFTLFPTIVHQLHNKGAECKYILSPRHVKPVSPSTLIANLRHRHSEETAIGPHPHKRAQRHGRITDVTVIDRDEKEKAYHLDNTENFAFLVS